MSIPSIAQTIIRGRISTYLAANDTAKGSLFGARKAPISFVSIAMVTDALDWGNAGNAQTDESLRDTANYLIWLCSKWGQEAEAISQGAGGGSVIPAGSTSPNPLDWIIGASTVPLATNETSVTLTQFIGYNINFIRGSLVQYTTNPGDGSTYYSWDKNSGLFSISSAAQLGEQMRIFI